MCICALTHTPLFCHPLLLRRAPRRRSPARTTLAPPLPLPARSLLCPHQDSPLGCSQLGPQKAVAATAILLQLVFSTESVSVPLKSDPDANRIPSLLCLFSLDQPPSPPPAKGSNRWKPLAQAPAHSHPPDEPSTLTASRLLFTLTPCPDKP